ncbi:tetratricopeptide repeat protein [Parafrankia sp. EUN1f]|uniref:tetratricopeptide repeat protein n=1 Tax=Parafrankia sp. EUN1f TaxID=102897 RepID=UPI0002F77311|nr:tetratricopeptide repeat protein [Parafrankia sp. EUN1f]
MASDSGRLPPVWNVRQRDPHFVGRDDELVRIHRALRGAASPGPAVGARGVGIVCAVGADEAGGVGRSELAVEYAHRHHGCYGLVWWVDAQTPARAESCLLGLAAILVPDVTGPGTTVLRGLWAELSRRADWLLIYDDVDAPLDLGIAAPPDTGHVIMIGRAPEVGRLMPTLVELGDLDRADSIRLLRRHDTRASEAEAALLAATVGDLPLALAQAGHFLAGTGLSIAAYLRRLDELHAPGTAETPGMAETPGTAEVAGTAEAGGAANEASGGGGLPRIVATSRAWLERDSPATAEILDGLALLATAPFPRVVADGVDVIGGELLRLGLVWRDVAEIRVHPLVRKWLRAGLGGEERRHRALRGALRLLTLAGRDLHDGAEVGHRSHLTQLEPHVQAVSAWMDAAGPAGAEAESAEFRRLTLLVVDFLHRSGRYEEGRGLSGPVRCRWARDLGPDHPDVLTAAVVEASILLDGLGADGGHATEAGFGGAPAPAAGPAPPAGSAPAPAATAAVVTARMLLTQAHSRRLRTLGPEHREVLVVASSLARAHGEIGDRAEAVRLYRDTLGRQRDRFGPDDPDTLRSAHGLGDILTRLGEFAEADILLRDTHDRRARRCGTDHLDTQTTAFVLGVALRGLALPCEARVLHEQVLAWARRQLGHEHPRTLDAALQLALDLVALGEVGRGRDLFTEVIGWEVFGWFDEPPTGPGTWVPRWAARHRTEIAKLWSGG